MVFVVRTFYRFTKLSGERCRQLQSRYLEAGTRLGIQGSILLAEEGCNATISAPPRPLKAFFALVREDFPGLMGQDSTAPYSPFPHFRVPVKRQIVCARDPAVSPAGNSSGQSDAAQWDELRSLVRRGEAQMIDVRNRYETAIGTFPEAIDPHTVTFKEFPDFVERERGRSLDPELPTAIFCTGGIRCEKARLDLEERGFRTVHQLKGGILHYLKESKEKGFEGECFVFDERVALDQDLEPSENYKLCPHCGGPTPVDGGPHDCGNGRRKV